MKTFVSIFVAGFCFCFVSRISSVRTEAVEKATLPRIDVILWFDTEDYLLPADDDAAKRLAELLTERGIRATFKVVGEKARTLERRGRTDVIAALKQHDIGYHANFHSVHPTPTEYLAECGWLDGVAEFVRREGGGAADVRRIFNVPTLSCYGQPGSSWGPQTIGGLKEIGVAPHGIPCYVDEGTQVGLDEKPFWYAGALNVFHMGGDYSYTRMELHDPAQVEPGKQKVSKIVDRLRGENGGIISIFYHPCEWVHRQFWDGVNFANGANPPRELWKAPGQLPAEETEGAFRRFAEYIDYIRAIPGVRFITASELPGIYPDRALSQGVSQKELNQLAQAITDSTTGATFQVLNEKSFSLADQFELLNEAVSELIQQHQIQFPLKPHGVFGPDSPTGTYAPPQNPTRFAFRDAALDVRSYLATEHRIPARVFIGSEAVAPADFLFAMATAFQHLAANNQAELGQLLPKNSQPIATEKYIAKDTPKLFGEWVIHKRGFQAPKVMEQARLQAWTLKPALRAP